MATNTRRIAKELENFAKNNECSENHIYLTAVNDNMLDLRGLVIGPRDSPFEGCFLYFSINPEGYPNLPPKVKFLTPYSSNCRMHPNLYAEGKVCLSILGTWGNMEWSPLLTFEKILLTIQGLLDNNPISHEPAYYTTTENNPKAIEYAVQSRWLALSSVLYTLKRNDLPQSFQEVIKNYYTKNIEIYKKSKSLLEKYNKKTISTIHGTHLIDLSMLTFE